MLFHAAYYNPMAGYVGLDKTLNQLMVFSIENFAEMFASDVGNVSW